MSMRTALVTGSRGFIGGHFIDRLRQAGDWRVHAIDIVNGVDCRAWFADPNFTHWFDLVVHAAAVVGGRMSIEHKSLAVAQNLGIDAAMFEWAARTEQPQVLYFSSSAAYPIDLQRATGLRRLRERDIDLNMVREPDSTYGWAKITGEKLAAIARRTGMKVHIVRPFSGYGPGQSLDYPFPSFIQRATKRADPFEIWGSGRQVRDFVHVDDIVTACFEFMGLADEQPLNIGTGIATNFLELAALMCGLVGYTPRFDYHYEAPEGAHHRVADVTRLHTVYVPEVTLIDGIERALKETKR